MHTSFRNQKKPLWSGRNNSKRVIPTLPINKTLAAHISGTGVPNPITPRPATPTPASSGFGIEFALAMALAMLVALALFPKPTFTRVGFHFIFVRYNIKT